MEQRGKLVRSQIISKNPILDQYTGLRNKYFNYLKQFIDKTGWEEEKYVKAQMLLYGKLLVNEDSGLENKSDKDSIGWKICKYFAIFDIVAIVGYDENKLNSKEMDMIIESISGSLEQTRQFYGRKYAKYYDRKYMKDVCDGLLGDRNAWKNVKEHFVMNKYKEYLNLIEENIKFSSKPPFQIMVTATMSAGKSTFINALTGKRISLSQNMACTSKIHAIISKPYEDGYTYEDDYDLVLDAGKEELLNDNELNDSDEIFVSTYYNGELGGCRIIINDSPGVNYSGDNTHKKITNQLINKKNYQLLIYLMNATQLTTNDEKEHLEYVKQTVGDIPILFVINKIDTFNSEDEDIEQTLENLKKYLEASGFSNPVVCPVSSLAGYLAKRNEKGLLSKIERRELYRLVDDFEQMKLTDYYKRIFPNILIPDAEREEIQLLKNSGIRYIEKIIYEYYAQNTQPYVVVRHNPYYLETVIAVDGIEILKDSNLHKMSQGRCLREWLNESFILNLIQEINSNDIKLEFF